MNIEQASEIAVKVLDKSPARNWLTTNALKHEVASMLMREVNTAIGNAYRDARQPDPLPRKDGDKTIFHHPV